MPRSNTSPAEPSSDTGFAVLEAKVEQVQLDAAADAEVNISEASMVSPPPAKPADFAKVRPGFEPPHTAEPVRTGRLATIDFPSPVAWLQAYTGWAQDGVRLQLDAMSKFAAVRGPHDLLAAQISYFTGLLDHGLSGASRFTQANPGHIAD